jgi:hypothetical protein
MMRMLDTQRLRHLQLVSLSLGCAMVIRFVCDSKYMKNIYFHGYGNTFYAYTYSLEPEENLCFFYDACNLFYMRSCLLIWLIMLHCSLLMKQRFAI